MQTKKKTVIINTHVQSSGQPDHPTTGCCEKKSSEVHTEERINTTKLIEEELNPKQTKDRERLYMAKVVFNYSLKRNIFN